MTISLLFVAGVLLLFCVISVSIAWKGLRNNSIKKTILPSNAIMKAKAQQLDDENLEHKASQFGILIISSGKIRTKSMLTRINSNPRLAKSLKEAHRNHVHIFVEDRFSINSGYLCIDEKASDEKIIKFLTE